MRFYAGGPPLPLASPGNGFRLAECDSKCTSEEGCDKSAQISNLSTSGKPPAVFGSCIYAGFNSVRTAWTGKGRRNARLWL
jgi:hypothetical protein